MRGPRTLVSRCGTASCYPLLSDCGLRIYIAVMPLATDYEPRSNLAFLNLTSCVPIFSFSWYVRGNALQYDQYLLCLRLRACRCPCHPIQGAQRRQASKKLAPRAAYAASHRQSAPDATERPAPPVQEMGGRIRVRLSSFCTQRIYSADEGHHKDRSTP